MGVSRIFQVKRNERRVIGEVDTEFAALFVSALDMSDELSAAFFHELKPTRKGKDKDGQDKDRAEIQSEGSDVVAPGAKPYGISRNVAGPADKKAGPRKSASNSRTVKKKR